VTEGETPEERRRRLNREAQQRCRERRKSGRKVISVEVDDVNITEALAAEGELDGAKDDNDDEVRAALERTIDRWAKRHA
jgi:hypothetical protein